MGSGNFSKPHVWVRFAKENIYSLETCAFSLMFMLSYFSFFLVFLIAIALLAGAFSPAAENVLNLVILQEEKSNAMFYNIL